jgi:YHS domain-containing protein
MPQVCVQEMGPEGMRTGFIRLLTGSTFVVSLSSPLMAQTPAASSASAGQQPPQPQHQHLQMNMPPAGWQFMQDGIVFGMFNRQGGPRGGQEFKVPNWWMGMGTRKLGSSQLTLTGMFSLDPATVGKRGYGEIFQVGEVVDGVPLIDRQHPHDLFMQLAAVWRIPITKRTGFTMAGGPAGEPALGPVAFMHRASSADNPMAPLSHHTFDSTHISYGVLTAALDRGPWVVEGSVFNGREPDEHRWGFDFGAPDSVSARLWFRPNDRWEFQASTGRLKDSEELEPGIVQRTTVSGSWFKKNGADFTAVAVGYGVNAAHETTRHAVFGEATRRAGSNSFFGRVEVRQSETALLVTDRNPAAGGVTIPPTCPSLVHCVDLDPLRRDAVGAFTLGGVRDVFTSNGFEGGLGAAVTFYAVPDALTATHGRHPVSFQLFFRLRPPASKTGRMWNMRMSQPMQGHASMSHDSMSHDPTMPAPHVEPHAAPKKPAPAASPQPMDHSKTPMPPAASPEATPKLPVIPAEESLDPRCATAIDRKTAPKATYQGKVYYFCSTADRDTFRKDPGAYLKKHPR